MMDLPVNVNKKILLEGKPIDLRLDGIGPIATSFAKLNVDSVKERESIIYRSWNIQFAQNTAAEEIDNAGHDEVQIMFNLNQDIDWFVKDKTKKAAFGLEGKKIQMARGEVCVFRNNDYSTAMKYQAGVNFKFKSMQMPTAFFRSLLSRYFEKPQIARMEERFLTSVVKTAITPEMLRVLSEIDTSERFKEYEGVYVEGKMIELTALVLYGIAYKKTDEIKRLPLPRKDDAERVEALREKIQRSPALEYDAPTVAQELGMSVSKLNRVFRAMYATSLHSYVQDKRLECAARLLKEDGTAISEAALKSGYTNMSHFSKAFLKKYGTLPKKFSKS